MQGSLGHKNVEKHCPEHGIAAQAVDGFLALQTKGRPLDRLFVIIARTSDSPTTTEPLTRLIQERGDALSAEIRAVNTDSR